MQQTEHDVIIIGGGINGVGIARDCALRGIKALLVEKHDFARGASGNNTGMIHGGIRYLRYDAHTTKMACQDSGYVQRIAPHLLFRVPFILPVLKGDAGGHLLLEGAEIFVEAYDRYQPLKRGKKHARLTRDEVLALEPGFSQDVIGAVTLDEWGIDAYRLTVANAVDAKNHGADIRTYCEQTEFLTEGTNISGIRFFDRITHQREEHRAPIVINATGGWGPRVTGRLGIPYKLRQSKGVHIVFGHRISNYGIIMFGVDGRQMFFLPHEKGTIIGTTDDDFYGDMDRPPILEDEIKYILQSARHVFPSVDRYRQMHSYVGVRPTLYAWGKNEDALSREHCIIDHGIDGFSGLYSIAGGKLAAYRQLAEEVTDLIAKRQGNNAVCMTHEKHLPGGEGTPDVAGLAEEFGISRLATSRLAYRHGNDSRDILAHAPAEDLDEVCLCEPVTGAELKYVAKKEIVRRFSDLCGRTRLGMGPCGGVHCLIRGSQVVSSALDWSARRQIVDLKETMATRFLARKNSLQGANLASEELHQMAAFLTSGLAPYMALAAQAGQEVLPNESAAEPADSVFNYRRN